MANNQLKEELILSTKQFDKRINEVIYKVEELKKRGAKVGGGFDSSMGKMIQRATGFNGSLSSLVGTVGKLGGALGLITTGINIADWFKTSVAEGSKLAMECEGIRLAFERLNKEGLLENLRKETHGTVSDMELMKQAVKFNDFNLPMEQMGTLLAFAQQKAKDTGESIDYMVDSIVTGLGRKSLPILDNLGLSASEIRERMKSGADMTTAVANIIKDRMEATGGYVETAADRAKKKEVELQNALVELGRTFQPLKESSSDFFHSLEIGAINAINKMKPLINQFTELGRIMNAYDSYGGEEKVNRMVSNLGEGKTKGAFNIYKKQLAEFDRHIDKVKLKLAGLNFGSNKNDAITQGQIAQTKEQLNALLKMRADYVKKANDLHNRKDKPTSSTTETTSAKTKTTKHVAVYKEDAKTVEEITDNIEVLNERLKKTVPNTAEYKKVSKEIETWRVKLEVVDVDENAKSIKALTNNVSILQNKLNGLEPNTDDFNKVSNELDKWQQKLDDTKDFIVNLKFNANATTIKDINNNINILNSKLNNTVKGSADWLLITKQIKDEQAKLRDYQIGSLSDLQNQISEIEQRLSNENLSIDTRLKLIDKKEEIQNKIDSITDDSYIKIIPIVQETKRKSNSVTNAQTNINKTVDLYDSGIIDYDTAKADIDKINQELLKIGVKPIKVHLETDTERLFANLEVNASSIVGGFEGVDNVISNINQLSESIYNGANAWETFINVLESGLSIIQALSDIINTVNTLTEIFGTTQTVAAEQTAEAAATEVAAAATVTTAKSGEAIAGATASGAKMPFPLNLVAIAAGIAAVVSALALVGNFANGGVVGGSSYAGDNLIARVNSGEMILNSREQKNLFNLLDKGTTNGVTNSNVSFVIRGKDLYGVLNNYEDKIKKVR